MRRHRIGRRHDAATAEMTSNPPDASSLLEAGEIDDAANVASFAQIHERLVDLVELVMPGDQFVEFQRARLLQRQQHRNARTRIHPAVERSSELLGR